LSENAHFVQALDEAGVTFIGPSTASMAGTHHDVPCALSLSLRGVAG